MSTMKFSRPRLAWFVLVWTRLRPVKPSIANVEIPELSNSRDQPSTFELIPPEPCIMTTSGNLPLPWAIRKTPATVTGRPDESPARNCSSLSVKLAIEWISVRAAKSLAGPGVDWADAAPTLAINMSPRTVLTSTDTSFSRAASRGDALERNTTATQWNARLGLSRACQALRGLAHCHPERPLRGGSASAARDHSGSGVPVRAPRKLPLTSLALARSLAADPE